MALIPTLKVADRATNNTDNGLSIPVNQAPAIAMELFPFEKFNGGEICFFGKYEGDVFYPQQAHIAFKGEAFGTTMVVTVGKRTNGIETRYPAGKAHEIMESLGLGMVIPEGGVGRPETSKSGERYLVMQYRR